MFLTKFASRCEAVHVASAMSTEAWQDVSAIEGGRTQNKLSSLTFQNLLRNSTLLISYSDSALAIAFSTQAGCPWPRVGSQAQGDLLPHRCTQA